MHASHGLLVYQDTRTIPMEYVEQKTAVSLEEGQAVFVAQKFPTGEKGGVLGGRPSGVRGTKLVIGSSCTSS